MYTNQHGIIKKVVPILPKLSLTATKTYSVMSLNSNKVHVRHRILHTQKKKKKKKKGTKAVNAQPRDPTKRLS